MKKFIQALLLAWWIVSPASGHVVSQISGKWRESNTWEIEVLFDAGYAVPEWRDDEQAPAPERKWLLEMGEPGWSKLRAEAEKYLRDHLQIRSGDSTLAWTAEFPDFAKSPPDFPRLLTDGAYFHLRIKGKDLLDKEAKFIWSATARPTFVLGLPGEPITYLTIQPGESKALPTKARPVVESKVAWLEAFIQGFLHVLPKGLDHILFILGLFLSHRKWRPLLYQSLTFTLAHTITLGLAAAGAVSFPSAWVEPLIALSLIVVALENLRPGHQPNSKWKLGIIFAFGLVHGLGFAGALSTWIQPGESFFISLLSANIGVELAQALILAAAWVLTIGWHESRHYEKFRFIGCLMIAVFGGFLLFQRL